MMLQGIPPRPLNGSPHRGLPRRASEDAVREASHVEARSPVTVTVLAAGRDHRVAHEPRPHYQPLDPDLANDGTAGSVKMAGGTNAFLVGSSCRGVPFMFRSSDVYRSSVCRLQR